MEEDIKELLRAVGRLEGRVGEIKEGVDAIKQAQEENGGRITRLETRVTLTQRWVAPVTFLGGVLGSFLAKMGLGTLIDV